MGTAVGVETREAKRRIYNMQPTAQHNTTTTQHHHYTKDGTVLHLASLFEEEPLPPVVCFAMGTLGFLTPFDAGDFR